MPRDFYPDTVRKSGEIADGKPLCLDTITFWDGPGICKRPKGHKVDPIMNPGVHGEFHQEEYEGWVWNNDGGIG